LQKYFGGETDRLTPIGFGRQALGLAMGSHTSINPRLRSKASGEAARPRKPI
jgi:hypothetical protein